MNNVAIVTGYNELYKEMADITLPNISMYAKRYDMPLYVCTDDIGQIELGIYRPFNYNKLLYMLKILPQYEWLLWVDIDCVFINHKIDIKKFIDDKFSIIMGYNYLGHHIENGVFFVKNDAISIDFLTKTYYDSLNVPEHMHQGNPYDQGAMTDVYVQYKNFEWNTKFIHSCLFNNLYCNIHNLSVKDSFVYHCTPCRDFKERIGRLKNALSDVI